MSCNRSEWNRKWEREIEGGKKERDMWIYFEFAGLWIVRFRAFALSLSSAFLLSFTSLPLQFRSTRFFMYILYSQWFRSIKYMYIHISYIYKRNIFFGRTFVRGSLMKTSEVKRVSSETTDLFLGLRLLLAGIYAYTIIFKFTKYNRLFRISLTMILYTQVYI